MRCSIIGGLGVAALALASAALAEDPTPTQSAAQPGDAGIAAASTSPPAAGATSAAAAASAPAAQASIPDTPADHIAPPAEGKGQVVFFRKSGFQGSLISCAVFENNVKLTSLPGGRFSAVDVAPGLHVFKVRSESTDLLRMEIEAGKTYYAQCTVSMGMMAGHPHLEPSDKATFFGYGLKLKPVKKEAGS